LAFDTLYAEGQRRYVESLSSYARQFLGRLNKPECDYIKGIPPAAAIEQKVNTSNPRSTVGTSTEIYDYIKLLYARAGQTISPISGREVKRDHTDDITRYILEDHLGKTVIILARPEHLQDVETLKLLLSQGFTRIKSGKAYHRIDDILAENKVLSSPSDLYLVIDRINITQEKDTVSRVSESVETALYEGKGECFIEIDVINVKPGYGRNYLIPQGYAILATEAAKKIVAENTKQRAHKEAKLKAEAEELAAKLAELKLTVGAKTSSTGKIFGSVNNIMISEALLAQGFDIDRKKIMLKEIKEVGTYTAVIKLHREVKVDVQFEVVSE
jgi:ribosomal protein L9